MNPHARLLFYRTEHIRRIVSPPHRLRREDGELRFRDAIPVRDAPEAREGGGDEGDGFAGKGLRVGRGGEGVEEGDGGSLAVDAGEETGAGRGEVGDGEADAVAIGAGEG